MDVRDLTSGRVLAPDAREARGFFGRGIGLSFRRSIPGGGLVIRPCSSIHMAFMRFPIDVVFFDRDLTVTKVARGVRPWIGFAFGGRGAAGVLEIPAGGARDTDIGHVLAFE